MDSPPPKTFFSPADVEQMRFIINRWGRFFNYQLFKVTKKPVAQLTGDTEITFMHIQKEY